MNAKEGSACPAPSAGGWTPSWETRRARRASAAETPDGPEGPHDPRRWTPGDAKTEHAHGKSAGLVGGLIAGGAAARRRGGVHALGVRAVLAMGRR
ncbi:MAG: hypothetical protein ACLTMP_13275 [Eggerthella lenta]